MNGCDEVVADGEDVGVRLEVGEVGVWVGVVEEDGWEGQLFAFFCDEDCAAGVGEGGEAYSAGGDGG